MTASDLAILMEGVGKLYPVSNQKQMLAARLLHPFRRRTEHFWALRGIDLHIPRGETLGIIGPNGSGKSTLLKIVSGVTAPTTGRVEVRGRVSSLLELGAGFHPYLSGRENVYLNGTLLGMTRKEVQSRLESIIEFSGIRPFIDTPVKDYSSGMYLRLAFAVAAHSDPEVLILDEVMAVGDEDFQKRSSGWIREFRSRGKTIVFVSHELRTISSICDRVLLLHGGQPRLLDSTEKVVRYYLRTVGQREAVAMLRQGECDAVFNSGQIGLFFRGHEQTLGYGLSTTFRGHGLHYGSWSAAWQVLEREPGRAVATGEWPGTGVKQTWSFGFEPDGEFTWEVAASGEGDAVQAEQLSVHIYLAPEFDHYVTPQEEGEIPPISPEERDDRQVTPWLPRRSRITLGASRAPAAPAIDIQIPDRDLNPTLAVLNGGFSLGARIVRVASRIDTRTGGLGPDPKPAFRLRIRSGLPGSELAALRSEYQAQRMLPVAGLRWEFRSGRGILHGPDGPWTTNLAVYTSLRVEAGWFDSTMGEWEVQRLAGGEVEARGLFPLLRLEQRWLVAAREDGSLRWRVELDCQKPLRLLRLQANLMLKPGFRYFRHPEGDGALPDGFRPDIGEDWDVAASCPLTVGRAAALSSVAAGQNGPEVWLEVVRSAADGRLNIVNSDDKACGRLVQWLRRDLSLPAGRSAVFEGVIRVRQ